MTDELWIEIPNWNGPNGFQHYPNRDPIWIKNYTRLLHKDEYRRLSMHQRGVLHSIWLAYAAGHRQLSGNTLRLTRQLGQRVLTRDLEALNHAGFITFSASKPLALVRARAPADDRSGEVEVEVEIPPDPPLPQAAGVGGDQEEDGSVESKRGRRGKPTPASQRAGLEEFVRRSIREGWSHWSLVDELVQSYGLEHGEAASLVAAQHASDGEGNGGKPVEPLELPEPPDEPRPPLEPPPAPLY